MGEAYPKRRLWQRAACALLTAVLCLVSLAPAAAEDGGAETIRVAFSIQPGLTERDENGDPTGYTTEYLQEVAQYTGWNYEFITPPGDTNTSLMAALEMVERGEVDIVGGLLYNDALAETYDYAAYSYGNAYTVLAVTETGRTVSESSLPHMEQLRVAVQQGAKRRIEELNQFCKMNKITPILIHCATAEEQVATLERGMADVMLSIDLALPDGMRTIARFAPRPFYLATTKGNSEVAAKLNGAIIGIEEANPSFTVELYEKYFGNHTQALSLSDEERAFIRGAGPIRVAVVPGRAPLQDIAPGTGEFCGVAKEIFDYIAKSTGLAFEFVPVEGGEGLPQLLASGMVDLVAGMPYDYQAADDYGVALSRPYLEAQVSIAMAKDMDMNALEDKLQAVTEGCIHDIPFSAQAASFQTIQDCLRAVNSGEADFTAHADYILQYYTSRGNYRGLTLVPQAGKSQEFCIGIRKPADATLLSILNRAIRSIPQEDIQAMVYRNAIPATKVTLAGFVADNPLFTVAIVLAVALLVLAVVITYFFGRIRVTRQKALENERYKQLAELTNEHIFEYDFAHDRVTLSEKSAKALGTNQVRENYRFRLQQDRSLVADGERAFFQQMLREKSGTGDFHFTMEDGSQRWFRIAAKMICDAAGKPVMSVGRLTDVQSEREELEQLAEKAQRDSLTGVYNADTTRQLVTRRMAEHAKEGGAMLVLDVDKFKDINDHHGHLTGDRVLVAMAALLEDIFRRGDVVGRPGGDEFLVYMDRVVDRAVVEERCRQVLAAVSSLAAPLDELHPTVSIGGAMLAEGMRYEELYEIADKALYAVKDGGRNGYELR